MRAEDVTALTNFASVILRAMVDDEGAVQASAVAGDDSIIIEIRVNPKDAGKVIGKSGRHITALRTIMQGIGGKYGVRVNLELIEENGRRARANDDTDPANFWNK